MSDMIDRRLSEQHQLMRRSCRAFVNDFVIPFIRAAWKRDHPNTPINTARARELYTPTGTNAKEMYARTRATRTEPQTDPLTHGFRGTNSTASLSYSDPHSGQRCSAGRPSSE